MGGRIKHQKKEREREREREEEKFKIYFSGDRWRS
jgi:hypothetical protein